MSRILSGTVVSMKQQKTIVVAVSRVKTHPLYKKKFAMTTKYQAHYEGEPKLKIGDRVLIEETSPISRHKHFKVARKLTAAEEVI